MFATIEDLKKRYGCKELAKRGDDGRGIIVDFNDPDLNLYDYPEIIERLQCALDDACADIMKALGCCFDLKCILALKEQGDTWQCLTKIQSQRARYYIHEDISLKDCDHIAYVNYEYSEKELKELCNCKCLYSDQGNPCYQKCHAFICVAPRNSCIPEPCIKCGCGDCDGCCCLPDEKAMKGRKW